MKKFIAVLLTLLVVGAIVFAGLFIFRAGNIESIEIVGDIQTLYFVNSTTDVNFNDADLKITYKDGSVKLKKLDKNLVSVKNFSTSIANNGLMTIIYKAKTIDVNYAVVCTGLYYLQSDVKYTYTGSGISTTKQGPYVCGIDEIGEDRTTTKEMIYFYGNGSCDYYSRNSSTIGSIWYLDDGHSDKSFNYNIKGSVLTVNLGKDKIYNISAQFSNDGELSLVSTESVYEIGTSFLKSKQEKSFIHYEMKGNRTFESKDIKVIYPDEDVIIFDRNSTFESNGKPLYLHITYHDNFAKHVYVRFNSGMFRSDKELDTSHKLYSGFVYGFYNGVQFGIDIEVL